MYSANTHKYVCPIFKTTFKNSQEVILASVFIGLLLRRMVRNGFLGVVLEEQYLYSNRVLTLFNEKAL